MHVGSAVKSVLYFKHGQTGGVMRAADFAAKYHFEPDGVNFYVGLSEAALTAVEPGKGLNAFHRRFFAEVIEWLNSGSALSKRVMLGLEPREEGNAFGFVEAHLNWVRLIAADLAEIQNQANDGKRLDIVVRYASEMNDQGNHLYGGRPHHFAQSFFRVREVFAAAAPDIKFAFSPALRVDCAEAQISSYWPGDEGVDYISGTWYTGSNQDFTGSVRNMSRYFLHRLAKGKPFAIDEFGGVCGAGNDVMLQRMLRELQSLNTTQGVTFDYLTFFLDAKWGANANLQFLQDEH